MRVRLIPVFVPLLVFAASARADSVLYTYEGDVVPYDASAGWEVFNPCEPPCVESIEGGSFLLRWSQASDLANFHLWVAQTPPASPSSLWVEWRFSSNHPLPPHSFTCDAHFRVNYVVIHESVSLYGDAIVSSSGDDAVLGLPIEEFRTLRFESSDGEKFSFSVDGLVFFTGSGISVHDTDFLQFGGLGGCIDDQIPNMFNAWDYVRYGELSSGEEVVATDPPRGFLDPSVYAGIDRFAVTFDAPSYLYIDDITVEVSDGDVPQVVATHRRDNDGPETLEIVLDRPMTTGETTTFTFDTGTGTQTISYTIDIQVPTTSTWGLVVLALACAITGVIILRRQAAT